MVASIFLNFLATYKPVIFPGLRFMNFDFSIHPGLFHNRDVGVPWTLTRPLKNGGFGRLGISILKWPLLFSGTCFKIRGWKIFDENLRVLHPEFFADLLQFYFAQIAAIPGGMGIKSWLLELLIFCRDVNGGFSIFPGKNKRESCKNHSKTCRPGISESYFGITVEAPILYHVITYSLQHSRLNIE